MRRLAEWSIPGLIGGAVAASTAANLGVYALGRYLDGSFGSTGGGGDVVLDVALIVGLTAVPLGLGLTAAAALGPTRPRSARAAVLVAVVVAVGATPLLTLPADLDGAGTIALALCHLTLVPIVAVVLGELARRAGVAGAPDEVGAATPEHAPGPGRAPGQAPLHRAPRPAWDADLANGALDDLDDGR